MLKRLISFMAMVIFVVFAVSVPAAFVEAVPNAYTTEIQSITSPTFAAKIDLAVLEVTAAIVSISTITADGGINSFNLNNISASASIGANSNTSVISTMQLAGGSEAPACTGLLI